MLRKILFAAAIAASLSACVVRPVYKSDNGVAAVFSSVALSQPTDRFTQIIDNKLADLLHNPGAGTNYEYKLKVIGHYNYRTNLIGSDRMNPDASAQAISGVIEAKADYVLETNSGRKLASGVVYSTISYDRLEQEYANLKARERSSIRVGEDLAQQIYMNLVARIVNKALPR